MTTTHAETTTYVQRVSDGEELVFTGPRPRARTETDPRDRILTHRNTAVGSKSDDSAPRELPEPRTPVS